MYSDSGPSLFRLGAKGDGEKETVGQATGRKVGHPRGLLLSMALLDAAKSLSAPVEEGLLIGNLTTLFFVFN